MYTITITQESMVETKQKSEYVVLGKEYKTRIEYDELDTSNLKDWKKLDSNQFEKAIYGYAEPISVAELQNTEIFKQRVSSLDLVAVINAINTPTIKFDGSMKNSSLLHPVLG